MMSMLVGVAWLLKALRFHDLRHTCAALVDLVSTSPLVYGSFPPSYSLTFDAGSRRLLEIVIYKGKHVCKR